jgi:GTP diphosphokinase / guanosine-3',5'-bis(diphosphate) 3'-diphosphatase
MTANINKIISQLKKTQPHFSTLPVEKSFGFLIEKIKHESGGCQREILNTALDTARNFSLKPILPELISAIILHPLLIRQPQLQTQITADLGQEIGFILKAYDYAYRHLNGVKIHERDLFSHTLNTTLLLAETKLNFQTIVASLLKHLPQFTPITHEVIKREFSEEVVELVSETNHLKELTMAHRQNSPEHWQQLLLMSVKDLRAILIKTCSLIDLLKNIDEVHPEQHQKIAVEAMNVYAPLVDILGSWRLKWQLEDYAFKILRPNDYRAIEQRFNIDEKKNRDKYIEKTKSILVEAAQKKGIPCDIDGRFKHFYSIYQKMRAKKKRFNEVHDVFALRVIVATEDECYRMLGIIHSLWKPQPRRVKDYISSPKQNNYRSLHTTVVGLNNRMTEFQIRTKQMDDEAKYGVAAHWFYKNGAVKTPAWIQYLIREKDRAPTKEEFFAKINSDLLSEKVFVFTPKEEIVILPKGATPIDFAYHVHSEIGHHFDRALINGQPVAPDYRLKNEDTVEISVDKSAVKVKPEWLKIAATDLARRKIEEYLNEKTT